MPSPLLLAALALALSLVPSSLANSPTVPLKVACIGDSITEGATLANPTQESYPPRLQRLLGTNVVVRNYGVSGRTLLKKGDFPYWKEGAYTQSRNWGPDVVIIKLGTNDSKPYNWKYGTNYVSDFEAFIDSYATLPSQPRIVLCTPAPVYRNGAFDIQPGTVATNIAPAVRDLAARRGLEVIDFHTRLANHSEWFPDTVHPNTKGAAVMAAIVAQQLLRVPPATEGPVMDVQTISNRRLVVRWPAETSGPTWVLQSAPVFGLNSNTVWTVVDPLPGRSSDFLQVTNSASTANLARFYRLWQP